jgi:hypothetical protein
MRPRSQNKADIPTDIPKVEVSTEPTSTVAAETNPPNGAEFALKHQIEALRHSEQLQRQHLEQQQREMLARQARLQDMRPPSREEKLAHWKQAGLSAANEQFLIEHPEMIDHDNLTAYATQQALASGVEHDSEAFRNAVKANFDTALRHLTAQVEHADPTPAFFAPPQARPAPEPATVRSALTSAPVSRGVPSSDRTLSVPSRVSLSPEEVQIAKASGITERQYAENKIRMMKMKASGEIQG